MLENTFGITNKADLKRAEEHLSKLKTKQLYESKDMSKIEIGTFKGLSYIHRYIFEDVYSFAGKLRDVNIVKGNFRFASVMYIEALLSNIDLMPQSTFDEIIEKYVEMNVAHPFRERDGRSMHIWLDLMLKAGISRVIDWNSVNKEEYFLAMERSPIKDIEIKHILKNALTDKINDHEIYMKGIDVSYYYEGYSECITEELR